ncbi:hypothetical protein [Lapidilactobacillus luobeiensis]|uniref:hypothetical protein n=1 Tax=Lapidilactobacillus luobeiensis TaxID=2950371 RepID=UPI0021C49F7D|nr:hypothetical protein [Lapidilactobacillus luobeiensis]
MDKKVLKLIQLLIYMGASFLCVYLVSDIIDNTVMKYITGVIVMVSGVLLGGKIGRAAR